MRWRPSAASAAVVSRGPSRSGSSRPGAICAPLTGGVPPKWDGATGWTGRFAPGTGRVASGEYAAGVWVDAGAGAIPARVVDPSGPVDQTGPDGLVPAGWFATADPASTSPGRSDGDGGPCCANPPPGCASPPGCAGAAGAGPPC